MMSNEQSCTKPQNLGLHQFPSAQWSACTPAQFDPEPETLNNCNTCGETAQDNIRQQGWIVTGLINPRMHWLSKFNVWQEVLG